jgi:hypothetical protein
MDVSEFDSSSSSGIARCIEDISLNSFPGAAEGCVGLVRCSARMSRGVCSCWIFLVCRMTQLRVNSLRIRYTCP